MAENVTVKPTPIQRNSFDVAIELLDLHQRTFALNNPEEIESLFAKYYSLAAVFNRKSVTELENLISEEVISKLGRPNNSSW